MREDYREKDGKMGLRMSISAITGIGWLVFLILWLFFYAGDYSIYQNIGILFVSLLLAGAIISVPWITLGLGSEFNLRWRVTISAVSGIGWLLFLIAWAFTYASDYDIYQNIAIFLVSVLVLGGINAVTWIPWGMRGE
ncbi:MAG: hypothetical protein ACLFVX_07750 [Archaeoglobaceae archaeon]